MQIFRNRHILTVNVMSLLLGMVLYFLNPMGEQAQEEAFSSWLKSLVKTQDKNAGELENRILLLSEEEMEFQHFLQRATELVHSHSDDFKLPIQNSDESTDRLFSLLIQEWNHFKNSSSGMGKALMIEQHKPHSVLPHLSVFAKNAVYKQAHQKFQASVVHSYENLTFEKDFHTIPLSGGTSIGAP